jgi:hypothetical protein
MAIGGVTIPVVTASVSNYLEVFDALTSIKRKFPARLLRQLKEHVYRLVLTTDMQDQLFVQDLEPETNASEVDVVIGVGMVERVSDIGYVGISRRDLLGDVLNIDCMYQADRIVVEALPQILRHPGNFPMYRYLREAGLLDDSGALIDPDSVDPRVARRVQQGATGFLPPRQYRDRAREVATEAGDLATLAKRGRPEDFVNWAPFCPEEGVDLGFLRAWLLANRDMFDGPSIQSSQWAKLVCLYDWYAFGLQLGYRATGSA